MWADMARTRWQAFAWAGHGWALRRRREREGEVVLKRAAVGCARSAAALLPPLSRAGGNISRCTSILVLHPPTLVFPPTTILASGFRRPTERDDLT